MNESNANHLLFLKQISDYYSNKIEVHGETPQGVDWNGSEGQTKRFEQLMKIAPVQSAYSISDLGCGYGALLDYLLEQKHLFQYTGYDIAPPMIEKANQRLRDGLSAKFILSDKVLMKTDFSVASGVFNVKNNTTPDEWLEYILRTLDNLNEKSNKGFSFNCLTSYSDPEKCQDYLYYADPLFFFDYCKSNYSKSVALLHDYGLYEFTILVRKN